jgi:hypothetical protein
VNPQSGEATPSPRLPRRSPAAAEEEEEEEEEEEKEGAADEEAPLVGRCRLHQ